MHAQSTARGHGRAKVVQVQQGKEPPNFRALFQGHMVVRLGGIASGYRNRAQQTTEGSTVHLFQVDVLYICF